MNLNPSEVNNYLQRFFGRYEDSLQEAWVEILESNPQTLEEIPLIGRRVRNNAIKQYMKRKHKEVSLYEPIGKNGDDKFTLESILQSPGGEDSEDGDSGEKGLYNKVVDFLIGEYFKQKNENMELRRRDLGLKAERLRLRQEGLNFRKERFESWKKLMEDKGKQKENQLRLKAQLQREKFKFKRESFYFNKKRGQRTATY